MMLDTTSFDLVVIDYLIMTKTNGRSCEEIIGVTGNALPSDLP
jgi:hypothetical protein